MKAKPKDRYRVYRDRSALTSNPFYWYRIRYGTSLGNSYDKPYLATTSPTMARRIAGFLNSRRTR